jgi:PQQ-dependent dehydrogenase (methanol/ethanol family)
MRSFIPLALAATAMCGLLSACDGGSFSGEAKSEWRILGGGSDQQYFSQNGEITSENVGELGLAWYADMETGDGLVGNPLVADGVVYQGGPPGKVYANDVKTGKSLWVYTPEIEYAENTSWTGYWGTHVNRGLALDGDNIYIGINCKMVAISRKTQKKVWETQSCDPTKMQAITGAPRVGGGKVFIGNSSGDMGADRGFVDAFDAKSGKHLWRFYTMPGDPSKPFENETMAMAAKTWGTDYYKYTQGGVSPWDAITYDEKTDTLYFGTDGPTPYAPTMRAPDAGDELFTNSIVAVNASTGAYKWHFQASQHDGWNLAASMHIMLANLPTEKGERRVVMTAPKNGFYYVLDAETGAFISAKNYVPVNWTTGLDPKTGRPNRSNEANYWEIKDRDVIPLPGDVGAHSWQAMAFNPKTNIVYVPVSYGITKMKIDPNVFGGAEADYYYGLKPGAKYKTHGELLAWDPKTQTAKWRAERKLPINGGILATAGGLVFQGTGDGKFEAFDAETGKKLWSFNVGGSIIAAPTTVMVGNEQYILVASGNGGASGMRGVPRLMNDLKSQGPARLLAFRIGGKTKLPIDPPKPFPRPALDRPTNVAAIAIGKTEYFKYSCGGCHGYDAQGSVPGIPDLRRMTPETSKNMHAIIIEGAYRSVGMPAHPNVTDAQLDGLRSFIFSKAWEQYDAENPGRK